MSSTHDVAAVSRLETPVIDARGVNKSFLRSEAEEIHALVDVSLTVRPGELVALVGPSGSGKTTLLNVLAGWEHAETGELSWRGDILESPSVLGWEELAIVPQSLGLMDELTLAENVQLPIRLAGASDFSFADELISELGLSPIARRLPDETSLGEQQRTAVARALVARPRLLMADEPTAHQDALWNRKVLEAVRSATARGTACIVASHHRETVEYCDRVIGIRDGEVRHVEELSSLVLKEEH